MAGEPPTYLTYSAQSTRTVRSRKFTWHQHVLNRPEPANSYEHGFALLNGTEPDAEELDWMAWRTANDVYRLGLA